MSEDSAASAAPRPHIDVLRGAPSPEELAALIAVLTEAYESEVATAPAPVRARTRWELSARSLRSDLDRESGWGGFTGR